MEYVAFILIAGLMISYALTIKKEEEAEADLNLLIPAIVSALVIHGVIHAAEQQEWASKSLEEIESDYEQLTGQKLNVQDLLEEAPLSVDHDFPLDS